MPAPARDEAKAPRLPLPLRVAGFFMAGLIVSALVLGAMRVVELVVNAIDAMRGLHSSTQIVATVSGLEAAVPTEVAEEPDPEPETPRAPRPPPLPVAAEEIAVVDAGYDAGPVDAGRFIPPPKVDATFEARPRAPTLAACNADLAHRVEEFYAPNVSLRVGFDQELIVGALSSVTRSRGTLLVARPGRMSWTYDEPENSRIVSDGQTVSVYEAPNKHLYRVPANASPYPAAFAFLTGGASLTALFDFAALVPENERRADFQTSCLLVGTPTFPTRIVQKVYFFVDRATLLVRRVVIFDRSGDRNRIDLSDPTLNVPIEGDEFSFTPPPDTIVVGR